MHLHVVPFDEATLLLSLGCTGARDTMELVVLQVKRVSESIQFNISRFVDAGLRLIYAEWSKIAHD